MTQLPPAYLAFLKENHIDPAIYEKQQPRFVRILRFRQRTVSEITSLVEQIANEAQCAASLVPNIKGFVRIDNPDVKLNQLEAYKAGEIMGIDISSGIAAMSLDVEPGNNILDLCCAPGAKLLLLADLLELEKADACGTVTGVDVSRHRMATCRSLVKKHSGQNKQYIRLYIQDGREFHVRAPKQGWWDPRVVQSASKELPGEDPAKPWFGTKMLQSKYACLGTELYDRVLVDAECTHDGSLAHVVKYERWGWDRLDQQVISNDRPQSVPRLQLELLENGWRMLKPGGILVYSTCSLSRFQNELVLYKFLSNHMEAQVEPIELLQDDKGPVASPIWQPESFADDKEQEIFARMRNAVRLDPQVSGTSGMFIARLRKPH
ncbi:S-adenosyl-L-methionine-dependent methyltransferase [Coemansia mojavensis]|nr:S-adenosyl-L-methionine-dependent methyltransferase [Coemansia mojavensis]